MTTRARDAVDGENEDARRVIVDGSLTMRRFDPRRSPSSSELDGEWTADARVETRARDDATWSLWDAAVIGALTVACAWGPAVCAYGAVRALGSGRTRRERRAKRRGLALAWVLSEAAWYASRRSVKKRYEEDDNMAAEPTRMDFDRFLQVRHDAVRDFKAFLYGWTKSWTNNWAGMASSFYGAPESPALPSSPQALSRASTPGLGDAMAVHREHAKDFLRFGFHDALSPEEIGEQKERELDSFIEEIEHNWNVKFDEGEKKEAFDFMFHTKEKLGALHQPLVFTAWVTSVACIAGLVLRSWGFRLHRGESGCSYWANFDIVVNDWKSAPSRTITRETRHGRGYETREVLCGDTSSGVDDEVKPIIFIHGLGVGLAPYLPHIAQLLRSKPGRKIACITLPHISMRASKSVPELEQIVNTVMEITKKHALCSPVLYGHSFGSFVVARACQKYFVNSVVLVDPVAVCLFLPHTVGILYQLNKSWLHFKSRMGEGLKVLGDASFWQESRWLVYFFLRDYFLLREIGVMTALRRKFWWARYNLWAEDLPGDALIVLESNDTLIDADAIGRHVLRQSKANVIYQEDFTHGEFFFPWGYGLRVEVVKFLDELPHVHHLLD